MKLKTITLAAAIAQTVGVFISMLQYVEFLDHGGRWNVDLGVIAASWGFRLVGRAVFAVFLFVVAARQKASSESRPSISP